MFLVSASGCHNGPAAFRNSFALLSDNLFQCWVSLFLGSWPVTFNPDEKNRGLPRIEACACSRVWFKHYLPALRFHDGSFGRKVLLRSARFGDSGGNVVLTLSMWIQPWIRVEHEKRDKCHVKINNDHGKNALQNWTLAKPSVSPRKGKNAGN